MTFTDKQISILEQAEILFSKKGCDATSVREISKAAKVNLAMISYYFGSKEKLIEALFTLRMQGKQLTIEAIVADNKLSPAEKINRMVLQFVDNVFTNQDFYRVMMTEQMLNSSKKILDYIKVLKLGYARQFGKVIDEGLQSKEFSIQPDIVLMSTILTGSVIQMLINKDFYRAFYSLEKISVDDFDLLIKEKITQYVLKTFYSFLGFEIIPEREF